MACEWRDAKIMDVAEVNTTTYSTSEKWEYVNYLDTSNITSGHISEIQLISDTNTLPSRARRKVRAGDIVYSTVRPNQRHYGIIKNPSDNMLVSTGFAVLRGKSQISDTKFLYYFLIQDHVINQLQTIAEHSTSTYPSIRPGDIESLGLKLPHLTEQQAIAYILGALDDKIELNRRMNKTLEEMARAIFKSWFVDFDPVYAKAAGQTPPGLTPEIAALFPDSFEDSELGQIPKGWKVGIVQNLGEVICGKTPPTIDKDNYGSDVPFVTIPDMHGKIFVTKTEKALSVKGAAIQKNKSLPPFSICVSCIATPGLVALTSQKCQTNQQINSVVPSDINTSTYCYFVLHELGDRIRMHGTGGSVLLNLNKSQFSSMKILLPPKEVAKVFQNITMPLFDRMLNNENEKLNLMIMRDVLLPKLITGEIRVPDTGKIIRRL